MISLDLKKPTIFSSFPKDQDWERVTENVGEIYLGGKKTIATDIFFIITNIKIDC